MTDTLPHNTISDKGDNMTQEPINVRLWTGRDGYVPWHLPFWTWMRPMFERGPSLTRWSYQGWHFWCGPLHIWRIIASHTNQDLGLHCKWQWIKFV